MLHDIETQHMQFTGQGEVTKKYLTVEISVSTYNSNTRYSYKLST